MFVKCFYIYVLKSNESNMKNEKKIKYVYICKTRNEIKCFFDIVYLKKNTNKFVYIFE